jgi:AcrR family transcriptional regulator
MSTSAEENAPVPPDSWAARAADRSPVLRERRSRNVHQIKTIVQAANRLIVQKGSGFTTQELAREAGVALQTFYRHFGSKDQLLLATLEDLMATHAARFAAEASDLPGPLARLRYYVMVMIGTLHDANPTRRLPQSQFITAEHWRLQQIFPQEMAEVTRPITDLFAREILIARDLGLIVVSDVDQCAELMVMLVRSVYHQYAFARQDEPTAAIAEHVWEFCLQGIGGRAEGRTAPH